MNAGLTAVATQQLSEFLAVVSGAADPDAAARIAAERACRALDAEAGAVVTAGEVVAAFGFAAGRVPTAELIEVADGRSSSLELHRIGTCLTQVAPVHGAAPGHLIVARSDLAFSVDEISLVRGMARGSRTDSGRIMGHEALVRWRHPDRGLVPPMEFIPLAEETGIIVPIGSWVLQEACRQTARWNVRRAATGAAPLQVNVNLSTRQVQHPAITSVVAATLAETGLQPDCLVLEVTESLLVTDAEAAIRQVRQLKALGVRLAIDDFGTGYSSLAYLRQFPVDIIKIDKSFVDELRQEASESTLARAIIALGRSLNLTTVAEGIEAVGQRDQLAHTGCQLGQGYYFARPVDRDAAEALLFSAEPANPRTLPARALPVAA